MPMTVITIKNSPPSLRGDLTKWTQEIATGVYVGNFNTKIREQLWKRIKENVKKGEATISFSHKNEIGYSFDTYNTNLSVVDFDGIPLVRFNNKSHNEFDNLQELGFSNASKYRKANIYSSKKLNNSDIEKFTPYIVLDIETDGLDENINKILEIACLKVERNKISKFHKIIQYQGKLPEEIVKLTGITNKLLDEKGQPLKNALTELIKFISDYPIIGYGINFDYRFLNKFLREYKMEEIKNKKYDIMRYVKQEKVFLKNYKLDTVLKEYNILKNVPHRALEDTKLIYELSTKVKKFSNILKQNG